MYCNNCGKEIDDNAVVCPHCGSATEKLSAATTPTAKNSLALVGLVLSFFVCLAGLIVSIMALNKSKQPEYAGDGKGMAIAGIIVSSIEILISVIYVIVVVAAVAAVGTGI